MTEQILHPGEKLSRLLDDKSLSQREFASRLDIAYSLLSNILNGNRPINIKLAISLQAAGFEDANKWLTWQMEYDLHEAQKDEALIQKQEEIKNLNQLEQWAPVSYLKKHLPETISNSIKAIYDVYDVNDIQSLQHKVQNYNFSNFRKSLKIKQNENNVIAWSYLAEYKAKLELVKAKPFDPTKEKEVIDKLKVCFFENKNDTISKTKKILNSYGIIFFTLDRPPQTPVDGKAFMCNENPTIVLSLKYNRLDNFAFNVMHELGHVFKHLAKAKYKNKTFFTNANVNIEEFEADNYAKDNLIDPVLWNDFISEHEEFDDESILKFAKKIKIHPAIVRGRICFEEPEYYRKRTSINAINVLQ